MVVLNNKFFRALNIFADWFIRITLINILVIICMLPIITIIPAISSGYRLFSDILRKDEENIFKAYFKYFKEDFVNKLIVSIIVIIVFLVSFYNNRLYGNLLETGASIFNTIGYYLTMALLFGTVMVTLYLPLIFSERKNIEILEIFKLAFYFAGKYPLRTILITLSLLIPYLMLTNPFTIVFFVFSGISIPLLINAALTLKARDFLKTMEVKKK